MAKPSKNICTHCGGTGDTLWGLCYRCKGKGYLTMPDYERNHKYDIKHSKGNRINVRNQDQH